jgi:hypothetical protein
MLQFSLFFDPSAILCVATDDEKVRSEGGEQFGLIWVATANEPIMQKRVT